MTGLKPELPVRVALVPVWETPPDTVRGGVTFVDALVVDRALLIFQEFTFTVLKAIAEIAQGEALSMISRTKANRILIIVAAEILLSEGH